VKNISIISILLLFLSFNVNATVHRVNNTGADADFDNLQDAHNAALSGDTLYIEASPSTYGNITINKKIHLIGPGYRLTENTGLQANVSNAKVAFITLQNGCSETSIQGLYIESSISGSSNHSFSDIIITRNLIIGGIYFSSSNPIEDIFIIGNEIRGTQNTYYSIRTLGASPKNLIVLNNIFRHATYAYISLINSTSAIFTNNIFEGRNIITTGCDFQNNIMITGTIDNPTLNTFSYNISTGTQFPAGNNNQQNVSNSSIFVGWPSIGNFSEDGRFALLDGSPAEGAGNGGVDCGIFAGPSPYILSGIPPIPTIYKFESPNVVTGNFTITLSTRSNN